jgi:hypothetical protein
MILIDRRGEKEQVTPTDPVEAKERLEYIRGELRAERISYGELAELADLIPFIEADDVELLEAAGVPEHGSEDTEEGV